MAEIVRNGLIVTVSDDSETPPSDGISCTVDTCVDGEPVHTPDRTLCDDDDPCTLEACGVDGCVYTRIEGCGEEDAGVEMDGGVRRDGGVDNEAVACSATGARGAFWPALLALFWVRRRPRRRPGVARRR